MARRKVIREETETASAATLQPGAGSGGGEGNVSRVSMMNDIVSSIGNMSTDDLTRLKEVLAQIGQEAANIPPNAAQNNLASIAPKGAATEAMREELEQIFDSADGTLTEEFVTKATTLFESAVNLRANLIVEEKVQLLEQQFNEAMDEYEEQIVESLDQYFDYFADEYLKENKLVIEHSLRNELLDSFLEGLHGLMREHYIDIPEDRVDVVEQLVAKVQQLEEENTELLESAIANKAVIVEQRKRAIIEEYTTGLTNIQASKFRTLTETIDFENEQSFTKKVSTIAEHYFRDAQRPTKKTSTDLLMEEAPAVNLVDVYEDDTATADPRMNKYVQAIARTVK